MKLLPILASLSKKDWHWLQKFVNSPIYNQHAAVVKLFEFFRKKPPVSEKGYSSEILHKNLFPETPFDASKTHHAVNYLLRSTEDYLAWDEWWQDEPERQRYLLQACRQRGSIATLPKRSKKWSGASNSSQFAMPTITDFATTLHWKPTIIRCKAADATQQSSCNHSQIGTMYRSWPKSSKMPVESSAASVFCILNSI
ncbi:MAG: hypothetical protein IPH31_17775 [Lewinellaceae bacterium]|nr:hypothetical protein [Lewinellaceae bacterium]